MANTHAFGRNSVDWYVCRKAGQNKDISTLVNDFANCQHGSIMVETGKSYLEYQFRFEILELEVFVNALNIFY